MSSIPLATPRPQAGPTRAPASQWLGQWLREPLLHFLLLGALLFAINHFANPANDPTRIVMGPEVDRTAREAFEKARGRPPEADELAALRERWLENEVLYREGLAMQLDRGDSMIRDRVVFKSLSMIESRLRLPDYDDATLKAWFEAHRERYDTPARFDFLESLPGGAANEASVRAFVDRLNGDMAGDAGAGLRVFKGRPLANIEQSYGKAFAQALESAPEGRWMALESASGWRAIRLETRHMPEPARYEALRHVVVQDWTDATMAELRSKEVAKLARKYRITEPTDTP